MYILDTVPYIAGNFRGKKLSQTGENYDFFFVEKTFQIAHFSRAKGHHIPKFHGETFTNSHKTVKCTGHESCVFLSHIQNQDVVVASELKKVHLTVNSYCNVPPRCNITKK